MTRNLVLSSLSPWPRPTHRSDVAKLAGITFAREDQTRDIHILRIFRNFCTFHVFRILRIFHIFRAFIAFTLPHLPLSVFGSLLYFAFCYALRSCHIPLLRLTPLAFSTLLITKPLRILWLDGASFADAYTRSMGLEIRSGLEGFV